MPSAPALKLAWDRAFYAVMIRLQSLRLYRALASQLHPAYTVVEASAEDLRAARAWTDALGDGADRPAPADTAGTVRHYVAKSRGRVIGCLDILHYGEECGAFAGYWGSGLRVRIGWRALGVGRSLAERGIADAKASGATELLLTVNADNLLAVKFYEKSGCTRRAMPELGAPSAGDDSPPGRSRIVMGIRL